MRHPKRSLRRTTRTRHPRHPGQEPEALAAEAWPESLRVQDCMTRGVLTVRWNAPVVEAWRLMRARRIRHLPVLDDARRLAGIVTDRDLRQVVLDPALQDLAEDRFLRALADLRIRDVMTWGVVTTRPTTPLREAARLMHRERIGALPVVQDGRVVGILTEADLVRALADALGAGVLSRPYRWAFMAP
jgi:acetoin utilization protein AcuB